MSRIKRQRREPRPAPRQLRVERLEDRSLLAIAAFTINLREDVGGSPGELASADAVEVGESFFVEILAQEFHPLFHGLHGVALNVAWDPAALEEIDSPFDLQQAVTEHLPLFRGGTLDNAAGTIDNLSGSAFHASGIGRQIGDGVAERFALLHFRAIADVDATLIRLSEGASSIVTTPATTFSSAQLSFEAQAIAILPADPQPATAFDSPAEPEIEPPLPIASPTPPEPDVIVGCDGTVITLPQDLPPDWFQIDWPTDVVDAEPDDQFVPPTSSVPDEPAAYFQFTARAAAADETADDPCLADAEFAAAADAVLMGPLTLEQCRPAMLRLEDVIAALAADVANRRKRTVIIPADLACS